MCWSSSISLVPASAGFCSFLGTSDRNETLRGSMEVVKSSLSYGKPPWEFKGRALYQLHLVKADIAREFIPKELKLVEAFGYTLGGFYLGSYDESPAGAFDEFIMMPGLVRNPSETAVGSWTSKALMNSDQVCSHAKQEFGLPCKIASFSKITAKPKKTINRSNDFLSMFSMDKNWSTEEEQMDIQVTERNGSAASDIFSIGLMTPTLVPGSNLSRSLGRDVKISVPNFSGCSVYNPNLLSYSCQIECRMRTVKPTKLSCSSRDWEELLEIGPMNPAREDHRTNGENLWISLMSSKPIVTMMLSNLKMQVEAPIAVPTSLIDSLLQ